MRFDSLTHLDDETLAGNFAVLVRDDRAAIAVLLQHMAELDLRRHYASTGYSSMFAYCVEGFRMSEDEAYKRITAARASRRFPAILALLAEGRLHLTAVRYVAPHLTHENAEELLVSAQGLSRSGLEQLLSSRFDRPVTPQAERSIVKPIVSSQPAVLQGFAIDLEGSGQLVPGPVEATLPLLPAFEMEEAPAPALLPAAVEPPQRFVLRFVVERVTHDKLRYLQSLLGHAVPSGDIAQIVDRAFDALIERVEQRKFAAATNPRAQGRRPTAAQARRIPAQVRRAVWARDEGRCTFIASSGHRCRSRRFLEFDHAEPVARGGLATVDGVRLRCRTHNQFEAERVFGKTFMKKKRDRSRAKGTGATAAGQT